MITVGRCVHCCFNKRNFMSDENRKLSCGGLIVCQKENNIEILLCRPRWDRDYWDLPKGGIENNELPLDCAEREIYEETNILLHSRLTHSYTDLGRVYYTKNKDLNLFVFKVYEKYTDLKCNSFFTDKKGKERPEIVDFKWVKFENIKDYVTDNMLKAILNSLINNSLNNMKG